MTFTPKQITKYQAEHLAELQGGVSETVIKYCLGLIPPFKSGDVIHDNACGSGAVTKAIMATKPSGIHIHATDVNPDFVAGVENSAEENGWPVTTAVMSMEGLTFDNDTFTQSITSFAIHCLGDHSDEAARRIHRTLKPGGVAVATIWTFMPHIGALQHAHWRTRGREGPMPTLLPLESFQEADLRATLQAGGFEPENITYTSATAHLTVPPNGLKRWAQLAWSYLGVRPSGWSQSDEDRWDEAIDDTVEQLQSGEGITVDVNGETIMEMRAVVAVAKK
ncbi:S-adenosyl-L-methionine-dependent methyltransferase [Xylaria palmicola]|nr:S-adenosyl-L-methionine-dependent methyltransferase [Xylaria palmicola]